MKKEKLKVCWISAGISSFMAGYLAGDVDRWIYIDVSDQHPDSIRFINDCEKVIGKKIEIVKSSEYRSVEDCIRTSGIIKLKTALLLVQIGLKSEFVKNGKKYIKIMN